MIGLAGSGHFAIRDSDRVTNWQRGDQSKWSGSVTHMLEDGSKVNSLYGPSPGPCVVIDGLFIGLDNLKLGCVRFDPQFRFHFYDLDFSLQAHRTGLFIGTAPIDVIHRSGGSFGSAEFQQSQEDFRKKWNSGIYLARQIMTRNGSCWCGSGKRYKHCHGILA